ncbi:MAG: hypothetical protein ACP5QD_04560 [Candidatus Ratteibacteria bacterium]
MKYADRTGVLRVVESISGIPGIIEMSPYRTSLDWQEKALVCFEKGFIEISLPAPLACNRAGKVKIYRDIPSPETRIPTLPPISAMYQQAMNFVLSIKGEAKPACFAEEALEDLRIARDYTKMLCTETRSQV